MRIGHGFDAHRLVQGRKLILGGIEIESDAGAHFPDTDERWKDADSMELLGHCSAQVSREGYRIENIDATIIVQRPKLAPYIARMRENIAARLAVSLAQVSVKAKTSEGMGYTGDGSGIAAYAVTILAPVS